MVVVRVLPVDVKVWLVHVEALFSLYCTSKPSMSEPWPAGASHST